MFHSEVSKVPLDVNLLFGEITRDNSDQITGAKAMIMNYYIKTADLLDPEVSVFRAFCFFLSIRSSQNEM